MSNSFNRHYSLGLGMTFVLLAGGCTLNTPVPPLESADVPSAWQGPVAAEAMVWPELDWWNAFDNEELTSIIAAVQANNFDLENNQRNLRNAQLQLREAGFNLLPTPSVTVGTGARYTETDTGALRNSSSPNQPFDLGASLSYNNILSKPSTYERSLAEYDSRLAQIASSSLNTLGTAASTYFQLLLIRDQLEAATLNVANAEAIAAFVNARVDAGVAVPIDALQQQIQVETQRNNLRSLEQRDLQTRSALALLMGRSVQGFDVSGMTLQTIEVPEVQPGMPSGLLRRRPDLVQAEASLRSQAANVDISYLNLFPNISLTGSFSASSTSLTDLVSDPDTVLSISTNLVQTILDNGQRYRNLEQARNNLESSLSSYRKAVIAAFNDIEVQLNNIQYLEAAEGVAERNLAAAEEAFRIAQVRYQEGVANYETVLRSQDSLFSTRNNYLNTRLQRLNAVLGLYQAMGGGWQVGDSPLLSSAE